MKLVLIILLVIFINSSSGAIQDNIVEAEELVAVVLIFRHGDRAPIISFPNDKYYNLFYWPMGFGELTKEGIQRQYKLGQWLRQRYDRFLNKTYSNLDIHVQSTDFDRTLMSASAVLAGLYPPTDFQVWNANLSWQPIPVHSGYETNIMELPCARYNKIYECVNEIINRDAEDKYSDLYQYIKENSGWNNITIKSVSTLRSVMYAYKNYNTSFIPEWVAKMNQTLLDHVAGVKYSIATATPTMARLKVGTFYDYIFKYFDNFKNSTLFKPSPKFMMMSSHDITIVSILDGMGLYETQPVGFGDTFIMELKKIEEDFFINLLYKSEEGLEKLVFRNCEFNCDYNTFKKSLINVTIDVETRKKECAN